MPRILGVDLPNDKRIIIALQYIYGIGITKSKKILETVGIDQNVKARDLTEDEVNRLGILLGSDRLEKEIVFSLVVTFHGAHCAKINERNSVPGPAKFQRLHRHAGQLPAKDHVHGLVRKVVRHRHQHTRVARAEHAIQRRLNSALQQRRIAIVERNRLRQQRAIADDERVIVAIEWIGSKKPFPAQLLHFIHSALGAQSRVPEIAERRLR